MSRNFRLIACAALAAVSATACIHQTNPELLSAWAELRAVKEKEANFTNFDPASYDYFVSHKQYPVNIEIYKDQELLARADKKSHVVICLEQQRGRLYVDGKVAADWPVSTGIPGRSTPTGKYSIVEKRESYSSNRYGKFYNAKGQCVNSDADVFSGSAPEGGRFVGSPMPYWMRLTWDGIGMHIGRVVAGKRLSHGCIRTPRAMAEQLYHIVGIGTKVTVNSELEDEFPAKEALAFSKEQGEMEQEINRLSQKIYDLQQEEQDNRNR